MVEDIYNRPPSDSDSTLQKRRSFGDQYMLFVRQNCKEYMENNLPPGKESIRDMVLIQDEHVPPIREVMHRIDYTQLTNLYIVDCVLNLDNSDIMKNLTLTTLVLSRTRLKKLPLSIFQIETLQILKVDNNHLEEIPADLGHLPNLKLFSCDRQRPRLRALPPSITQLVGLQVLSISNNCIPNINFVINLPHLRILRCDRNRITRLPNQIINLRELMVLDISHNRLEYIPSSFIDLLRRLYFFRYFNITLRPTYVREDKSLLLAHLELENYLMQPAQSLRTVRDVSVAVVGESHSGKSTLVEALKSDRGICKMDIKQESRFDIQQFEMHSNDECCYVSTITLANDVLDNFCKNIQVDLYLLVVDLTSLELQNGSQHLFARHVNRMQMWLEALFEIAPYTPVLIVGTHAEMVKSMSFNDIWHILENFLDQGRAHHMKQYADNRLNNCLLCNPKGMAVRHVLAKSRSGSAGFVDLSYPNAEPVMNGHVPTGDSVPPGRLKFPHVLGYYEIDSKKNLPKDAKKNNISIEQLKGAIMRMTVGSPDEGIPLCWLSFIRNIATINDQAPNLPCIPYDEIISIARSFDITQTQVPLMLQYFHNRGKIVYFGGDEILSKLVVINPTWFIQILSKLLEGLDRSHVALSDLLEILQDKELDRQLQKAGIVSIASAHWLVAALQRLDICVPVQDTIDDRVFLFPNMLELGNMSCEIWPDLPEWDEKQVTYEFFLRTLKPCLFSDLIMRLNREGRKTLEIVAEPAPVFLANHIVFFSGVDMGGCEDCDSVRQHLRRRQPIGEDHYLDDILHKVHVQFNARLNSIKITVRGLSPCCTVKAVLEFMELYMDDRPEDENEYREIRSARHPHRMYDEELIDRCSLHCPKCVLLRQASPEKMLRETINSKRKAICSKWHNLGSWTRALTGDYRWQEQTTNGSLTCLPENEHPRLVMILPPSLAVSHKDWYLFCRMKFLEGFEVHFLCEYTGHWHLTDEPGYRLNQSPEFISKVGNQLPKLLNMALQMVQVVNGVHEHPQNGKLLTPVTSDLIKMYDYLRNVDTHIQDTYTWLNKNKDRVVNMLTKVLANANDGLPDLYFKVGNSLKAESIFNGPCPGKREDIARFLRIEASSGRFGALRPLYVGKEVRWLCDTHYEELRSMPSTAS